MNTIKEEILNNIGYTELVYDRIRKKLTINSSQEEIEKKLWEIIKKTEDQFFKKRGKNFYISNTKEHISITINSNTDRVITVDKLNN